MYRKIYPVAFVEYDGDKSEMAIDWAEDNSDKVKILQYRVVFEDFEGNQKRVSFEDKEEFFKAILMIESSNRV
ncbi:hypothetical protein ThvES_00011180 [Thiovulum sp. ES]|nr:hypothetical protein ThvES_00011180 [Thiovulum sp. ES]